MTWTSNSYPTSRSAAQAYARVDLETGVAGADPLRLVLMLYDGALKSLAHARGHIQRGEIAAKGMALSRAIQIINEGLIASLDLSNGGGLAMQLKELYEYMKRRIVHANARNDALVLDEVSNLLRELRQAWAAIGGER